MVNDWTTYRATCAECSRVDGCKRGKTPGVCAGFRLSFDAEAARYVSAKRYAEKIGMKYDASGIIYRGFIRQVRERIDKLLRGGKING